MTESHSRRWLSYFSRGYLGARDESIAVPARSLPIPKGVGLHRICEPIDALVEYETFFLVAAQCPMRLTSNGQHRFCTRIDRQLENVVRAAQQDFLA